MKIAEIDKKMEKRRKKLQVEYYIFNLTVLPAERNTNEYYTDLIKKFMNKNHMIEYGNDFYYTMTELSSFNNGEAYYAVISKYLQLDTIDWIKTDDQGSESFEIPSNFKGRKSMYELVFLPKHHLIAFVKKGKINPENKRKGAPRKSLQNILKMGFEKLVSEEKEVHIDVIQSKQIFEKIYSSEVTKLDLTLHYTNPSTNKDHEEFMDDLIRSSNIGIARMSLTPDSSGSIDTNEKFVNGSLGIAKANGKVKAKIRTESGIETINTEDHPEELIAEVENSSNVMTSFIRSIVNGLKQVINE